MLHVCQSLLNTDDYAGCLANNGHLTSVDVFLGIPKLPIPPYVMARPSEILGCIP